MRGVIERETYRPRPRLEVLVQGFGRTSPFANVIGISGKIGTGKSSVAEAIGFERKSFASFLREEVGDFVGKSPEWVRTHKDELFSLSPVVGERLQTDKATLTVREILQRWGTDYRRAQDPDYWVKQMRAFASSRTEPLVIDDVRFPNEAELVHELGGLLVRIEPFDGWQPGPFANHESETALDAYERFHLLIWPSLGAVQEAADIVLREFSLAQTACRGKRDSVEMAP